MKKITSLLALLLVSCIGAFAQTVAVLNTEINLITDASQISSPFTTTDQQCSDIEEVYTYLLDGNTSTYWHSRWEGGNVEAGTHYLQVEVSDLPEEWGFTFTRRPVANDHITMWSVYGVPSDNPEASKDECTLIAEFETPFTSNNETLSSPILQSQGFTIVRFYGEEMHPNTRGYWHISELSINPIMQQSAIEVAIAEAAAVYAQYVDYAGSFTAGTNPGDFGVAEVEAFETALTNAEILDGPEAANLTLEQIQKLAEDIKNTYEAVRNSRIPFATEIAEGYYYIYNALDFVTTETTDDTEDPETGETIPGETIETHHKKSIYTDGNNGKWADLVAEDANFLWKVVAAGDKKYHLINCQNETQFTAIKQSTAITLSSESDSLVVFDASGVEGTYNIRLASQAERGYLYIHCGGHGGGAGVSGNLVGWCNTVEDGVAHASEWKLEAVDEATALAIIEACSPAKKLKEMTEKAKEILAAAPAQITIAKDVMTEIDSQNPLVTDPAQFYSPMTTTDTQCDDIEEVYSYLLDNKATYWHSRWEDGNRPNGADYIEISDINAENIAFKMIRRPVQNDHITQASVYGFDEARSEAAKEEGELLAEFALPFTSNTEILTSPVIETKGHTVLRIYAEATTNNRGYWHMSEFQMWPATTSQVYATSQAEKRAAEIAALEAAIETWKALPLEQVTEPAQIENEYNALVAAYEAWTKVYVNPAELRNAIANAPTTEGVKIGKNPGEWSNTDALNAVNTLIANAKAYDEACVYTPEQTAELLKQFADADSILYASANPVKTGKWYRLRFGTEEEYDAAQWDKTPVQEVINETADVEVSHALYGKVIATAKHQNETISFTNEDGEDRTVTQYNVVELENDDPTLDAPVAFIDTEELSNADYALWQFIAIGDSAYVLQNKATGLYLRAAGATGATRISAQPTLFNTRAIGYGKSLVKAKAIDGADNNYLHAERSTNNLVTWNASTVESNSAIYIEEIADVTEQPSNECTMSVWPGALEIMCFPTSLQVKNGGTFYTASIEATETSATVTLSPIEGTIEAGRAVIFVADGEYTKVVTDTESENYNADQYELATLVHGTEFVNKVLTYEALQGTYTATTVAKGNLVANGTDELVVAKNASNSVYANGGYMKAELDRAATVELVISENAVDAIENAIANVNKTGLIYTVDGKLVGNGNLNSLKGMAKGVYVINGVKVLVK